MGKKCEMPGIEQEHPTRNVLENAWNGVVLFFCIILVTERESDRERELSLSRSWGWEEERPWERG